MPRGKKASAAVAPQSKAAFVRTMPVGMDVAEVVAAGQKAGFTDMTPGDVRVTRFKMKCSGPKGTAPKRRGRPPKSMAVPVAQSVAVPVDPKARHSRRVRVPRDVSDMRAPMPPKPSGEPIGAIALKSSWSTVNPSQWDGVIPGLESSDPDQLETSIEVAEVLLKGARRRLDRIQLGPLPEGP